ncbi:MAG: hypothetical protein M3256_01490 [Actinomycetota bacterium]|nr:hypothetical protein [Actinomycetota bacterium]
MWSLRGALRAATIAVVLALTACQSAGWPPDPASKPSEVTGRIWYCTPGYVDGQPVGAKASDSAVKLEIVTAGRDGADGRRFPPNTVLGQATAQAGQVWRTGSVHQLSVVWLQPDITRTDLQSPPLRIRITRSVTSAPLFRGADRWVFSFFISLDVVEDNDSGVPETDWHLAVISTGDVTAHSDTETVLDTPFADLRGWPHPCPHG